MVESIQHDRGTSDSISDGDRYRFFLQVNSTSGSGSYYSLTNTSGDSTGNDAIRAGISSNAIDFYTYNSSGSLITADEGNGSINADQWYKFVITINPSQSQAEFEVRDLGGNLVTSATLSTSGATNIQYVYLESLDGGGHNGFFDKVSYSAVTKGEESTGNGNLILDWTNIADAQDIALYDNNDNLLDYEIESLDTTAETGVIWVYNDWVRDDTAQLKVAYGDNSANTDRQNVTGTWGNTGQNAQMVQHLNGDVLDSTANNNDGTVSGASSGATGQFNSAYSFDGTDDSIEFTGFSASDGSNPFTIIAWAEFANISSEQVVYDQGFNSQIFATANDYDQGDGVNHHWKVSGKDSGGSYINSPRILEVFNSDTFYHTVAEFDGSTLRTSIDGLANTASASVSSVQTGGDFRIGQQDGFGIQMNGVIDEVRVYSDSKDSAWKQADYDASPKAGQVFFSQQAAEDTTTVQTISIPESTGTGTTPNPTINAGNVNVQVPESTATGTTPNPSIFTDQFISVPVSTGNAQNPNPTITAGAATVSIPESKGAGTTPNPSITVGNTIRVPASTGTATTPNPAVKGGERTINIPVSQATGETLNPSIFSDQTISIVASTGQASTPEPQIIGGPSTVRIPVSQGTGSTPNPAVSISIVPRDSSTLVDIRKSQDKTLSGDIDK